MEVYAINYGNPNIDEEVTHNLYTTQKLAIENAISNARESVGEEDEGWTMECDIPDSDGNTIIMVKTSSGDEAEWWRVVTMTVHNS